MATDCDGTDYIGNNDEVQSLLELQSAEPVKARRIFRQGHYFKQVTSGLCRGFTQANIAGFPGPFAEDFAAFCRANEGPLPLLNCYPAGVFSAPGLADDADIRTDLTAYNVLQDGEYTEAVKDLLGYGDILNDFSFAYTGCSFSFDKVLLDAGVSLSYADDPDVTVSMYTTNIPSHQIGPFAGPIVVSMRPIPRDMVEVVVRATHPLKDVHGAPMHIGNPACIGIHDLRRVNYGDPPPHLKENEVPVFWGCGNTIKEVLKYSKLPLSFTMYSDCMYICDTPVGSTQAAGDMNTADDADTPIVIDITENPYTASVLSQAVLHRIRHLEQILKSMKSSTVAVNDEYDLLKTSLAVSHASSIAMIIDPQSTPSSTGHDSTHMMATIAMATLLQELGKNVTLIVEPGNFQSLEKVKVALVEQGILQESITLLQYPCDGETGNSEINTRGFLTQPDASYDYLMSLGSISTTSHLQQLLLAARDLNIATTPDLYHLDYPCGTPGDILFGYASTIVLYWLRQCPIHDRYRRYGIGLPPSNEDIQRFRDALPSIEKEARVLDALVQSKMCSLPIGDEVETTNRRLSQLLDVLSK